MSKPPCRTDFNVLIMHSPACSSGSLDAVSAYGLWATGVTSVGLHTLITKMTCTLHISARALLASSSYTLASKVVSHGPLGKLGGENSSRQIFWIHWESWLISKKSLFKAPLLQTKTTSAGPPVRLQKTAVGSLPQQMANPQRMIFLMQVNALPPGRFVG